MKQFLLLLLWLVPSLAYADYPRAALKPLHFILTDATDGSLVTSGTPVIYVTEDAGTQAVSANGAVHEGNGQWSWTPASGETDCTSFGVLITESGSNSVAFQITTEPVGGTRADVIQWNSTNVATPNTAGYPVVTIKDGTGTGEIALTAGVIDIVQDVAAGVTLVNNAITPAKFTAGAIDAAAIATDAIGASELAADSIGASELAADAIGSSEVAATATTEIQTGLALATDLTDVKTKTDFLPSVMAGASGGLAILDPGLRVKADTEHINGSDAQTVIEDAVQLELGDLETDVDTAVTQATIAATQATTAATQATLSLKPTTAGRTLDILATGEAASNVTHYNGLAGAFTVNVPNVNTTQIAGTEATTLINSALDDYGAIKPSVAGRTINVTDTGAVAALGADSITAAAIATDSGTELATATWALGTREITGGTITTYTGNTPQTGDSFARIGPNGENLTAMDVEITADDVEDIIAGVTTAFTVSPYLVDSSHSWRFNRPDELTSPITIRETVEFDGLVEMQFSKSFPQGASIASVTEVTAETSEGVEVTDELTLGTPLVTPDKKSVHLPVETLEEGNYVISIKITTTDSQVYTRRGNLLVQ